MIRGPELAISSAVTWPSPLTSVTHDVRDGDAVVHLPGHVGSELVPRHLSVAIRVEGVEDDPLAGRPLLLQRALLVALLLARELLPRDLVVVIRVVIAELLGGLVL